MKLIGYFFGVKLYADTDSASTAVDLASRLSTTINGAPVDPAAPTVWPALSSDVRDDLADALAAMVDVEPAQDLEALRTEFKRVTAQRLLASYLQLLEDV